MTQIPDLGGWLFLGESKGEGEGEGHPMQQLNNTMKAMTAALSILSGGCYQNWTASALTEWIGSVTFTQAMWTIGAAAFMLVLSKIVFSHDWRTAPMSTQKLKVHCPHFQGWFVRGVDHDRQQSFVLIAGWFSEAESPDYSQHYVYCAAESPLASHSVEAFPSVDQVTISNASDGLRWEAEGVGALHIGDSSITADVQVSGMTLSFRAAQRMPWAEGRRSGGPEGWLGYLAPLLPCHYHVHSVGSDCAYTLQLPDGTAVQGSAFCHCEGNYGAAFPEGWAWAQGIAAGNAASFSLAIGMFAIGPISPVTCVLYLRRQGGQRAVLRTVDLDSIAYLLDGTQRTVQIDGSSFIKRCSMKLRIADRSSTMHRVRVPTAQGFAAQPGCLETYSAMATLEYHEHGVDETYSFPLTALEFGGSFIRRTLRSGSNREQESS